MCSFLCVSMKFQPISASFAPVRREGKKKGKDGNIGNDRLLSRSIISWNIASIHILPPPGYAQMHSPSFRARQTEIQAFLSCGPAPKPPKPSQNEAIHACPEKVCPTETVALGKAWVGDANLNLARAGKESLTHSTPQGCRLFRPERRNLTQILHLQDV